MPSTRRSNRKARKEPAQPEPAGPLPEPTSSETGRTVEAQSKKKKRDTTKETPLPKKKRTSAPAHIEEDAEVNGIETEQEEEEIEENGVAEKLAASPKQRKGVAARAAKEKREEDKEEDDDDACFLGDPVADEEARLRWPHRYSTKRDDETVRARCHYLQARVDGCVYNLNDDVYVKAGEQEPHYIGRILELFEACDRELYFTAQWFFRAEDTVIKEHAGRHDSRRVFLSDDKNDNELNCIVRKVRIIHIPSKVGPVMDDEISGYELYYDMSFSVAYSSFACLPSDVLDSNRTSSSIITSTSDSEESIPKQKRELSLLDMFSGCGAMSSGLCLGANLAGVPLKTCWAVDMNKHACKSLQINHPKTEVFMLTGNFFILRPQTEVRNEKAGDFLELVRHWEKLCEKYVVQNDGSDSPLDDSDEEKEMQKQSTVSNGEFEVEKLVGICYGPTDNLEADGLKFKVRWMGYGPSDDTWEPIEGLCNCQEKIKEFVQKGYRKHILPLPGSVDVICGGPPCQGISGFNRFRNKEDPLKDEKNKQMVIFMQIVEYLRPSFVLMENVVDILKFAGGYLGRYALSQLVHMRYQARLGILAAGNYGLPQYRMRAFLWGAHPSQKLPQFPLPTHDVITRGGPPVEFEGNVVAYDGSQHQQLEKALRLVDAISDLPPIENDESRDEMGYGGSPKTEFQEYIRLSQEEMMHPSSEKPAKNKILFDHRPLQLNEDDYQRVCQIPKRKGANFRDLRGVIVDSGNVVQWDPSVERVLLPSGKPLVPDYCMSFVNGKSSKPFGRLWWDETVPTVVTRAEPHNQIIIHPEQDRVLSIRENARLQGFPDYYKLSGPIKERYIQVGNAVAFPVSRALGYAFGVAYLGKADEEPALVLPRKAFMRT